MSKYAEQKKHQHLYSKQRWTNRARYHLKQNPVCVMCREHGVLTIARVADHIIPHHGDDKLFWFGELQSLCFNHHNSSKRQIESSGYVKDIGTDGYPVDEDHPFNKASKRKRGDDG